MKTNKIAEFQQGSLSFSSQSPTQNPIRKSNSKLFPTLYCYIEYADLIMLIFDFPNINFYYYFLWIFLLLLVVLFYAMLLLFAPIHLVPLYLFNVNETCFNPTNVFIYLKYSTIIYSNMLEGILWWKCDLFRDFVRFRLLLGSYFIPLELLLFPGIYEQYYSKIHTIRWNGCESIFWE